MQSTDFFPNLHLSLTYILDSTCCHKYILTMIENNGVFLVGDFNSRIGNLSDILSEVDDIPKPKPIDNSMNQHGHDFIDFLNETKLCILNGRLSDHDNYTSISEKGKTVVDSNCIP